MNSPNDMAGIPCPNCHTSVAEEVIHAKSLDSEGTRVGWYCPVCKHFEPAVLRERKVAE